MSDAAQEIKREMRRKSRRSFLVGGIAAITGATAFSWLRGRRYDDGVPWPLRSALEVNGQLWRDFFSSSHLAPTFSKDQAEMPRENGAEGLDESFDLSSWRLQVLATADTQPTVFTLDDIKAM